MVYTYNVEFNNKIQYVLNEKKIAVYSCPPRGIQIIILAIVCT